MASVALVWATSWLAAACWAAVGCPLGTGAITMPSDMTVVPLTLGQAAEVVCAVPAEVDEPEPDAPAAMPAMPGIDVDPELAVDPDEFEPDPDPEPELDPAPFDDGAEGRRRGRGHRMGRGVGHRRGGQHEHGGDAHRRQCGPPHPRRQAEVRPALGDPLLETLHCAPPRDLFGASIDPRCQGRATRVLGNCDQRESGVRICIAPPCVPICPARNPSRRAAPNTSRGHSRRVSPTSGS